MVGLMLVVVLTLAHLVTVVVGIVKAARVRHSVALGLGLVAFAATALAVFPFPHVSPLTGLSAVIASGVVVGVTWRRKATLPVNDPAVVQADAVTGTFLLLGILGVLEIVPYVMAAMLAL